MAFCDWCRLDSQNEDACDWCKRPIRRNYNIYGNAVALLREDDEVPGDRMALASGAVIGLALLGLIGYAVINFRGGDTGKTDPLSQIAETEKTWTAERSAPAPVAAVTPQPSVPAAASRAPAPRPAPRGIASTAPARTPRSSTATSGYAVASSAWLRDGDVATSSTATGFYLEKANLKVGKQTNGDYAISGDIRIANTSGGRISDIEVKLVAGNREVPLDLGGQDTDLGNGAARSFRVSANDLPADLVNARDAFIKVSGVGADGPYHDRISLK